MKSLSADTQAMKHFLNLLLFKLLHHCRWKIIREFKTDYTREGDTVESIRTFILQCQDCGKIKRTEG
jgi:hypothetical protein